ncbi:MAG TPA: hypothetical protein VIP79_02205 [Gemmatimonadaceae bacterium]
MPYRTITLDGKRWAVSPAGHVTQYNRDEFALFFISGTGDEREVRVTRYSPTGSRWRDQSFAELSEADLLRLLRESQPSDTSPEAGYLP